MIEQTGKTIEQAVLQYEKAHRLEGFWKKPLVRIIPADHPYMLSLKQIVSPGHLLPADLLPGAKSIISFFIPFDDRIPESNKGGTYSSELWASAYIETNSLIAAIGDTLEQELQKTGNRAGKIPATHNFDETTLISDWSHRHIAYIAGLGTFGINNMLITEQGCCGRFGTMVTDYDHTAYGTGILRESAIKEKCLYKLNGSCGICRKNCTAGAYTPEGFDRNICYALCVENAGRHASIGGYADVCGKCLAGLPCSTKDPASA
ncbi:MAG: hypothetical protein LBD55_02040 [Treponema sp.]|jgi:epoxyqueuosine reductase QueG|nr:hypothetical protein [Treponema sp.]